MQTKPMSGLLSAIMIAGLVLCGCEPQPARPAERKHVIQDLDESANKQLQKITGNEKPSAEPAKDIPQEESDKPQETQDESSTAEQEEKKSPLDAAVQKLNDQEIVDNRQRPEPEPREPHEALKPFIEKDWVRLNPGFEVWADLKNKQIIVGGRISLREGLLEMFACPMDTKEHESVISTISNAKSIHEGLLAIGAIPGMPGYWTEETGVVTAMGPVLNITVAWQDGDNEEDRKQVEAKEMVIDLQTGKTMPHKWVFAGSRWWQDPDNASYREYQADWGDMICVSNFPTAMIDLNVESSNSNSSLAFGANPEKVPTLGQPVLIFIKPDLTTNPDPAVVAAAIRKRDELEAKMMAELEARMKEIEEREEKVNAEQHADEKKPVASPSKKGGTSGSDKSESDKSDG